MDKYLSQTRRFVALNFFDRFSVLWGFLEFVELIKNPVSFVLRKYREKGDVFLVRVFFFKIFIFVGPSAHREVLLKDEEILSFSDLFEVFLPFLYGKNFRVNRETGFPLGSPAPILGPLFRERQLERYSQRIGSAASRVLDSHPLEGKREFYTFAQDLVMAASVGTFFGDFCDLKWVANFSKIYNELHKSFGISSFALSRMGFQRRSWEQRRLQLGSQVKSLLDVLSVENGDVNLLSVLRSHRFADGSMLSEEEIVGMVIQVLLAAHGPSSVSLCWTLFHIVQDRRVKKIVQDEVTLLAGDNDLLSLRSLRKSIYIDWCIREALRLNPTSYLIGRKVRSDFCYRGLTIPKGAVAMILPEASHRLEDIFPRPDVFEPERFSPDRGEDRRVLLSIVNFGGGEHLCLGQSLAITIVKILLVQILIRFDVELDPVCSYGKQRSAFLVGPKKPFSFYFTAKNSSVHTKL